MSKEEKDSKKAPKQTPQTKPKEMEEKQGFPEDVDFKRFLGCGG